MKLHSLSADLHVGFPFFCGGYVFQEYFSGIFWGGVKKCSRDSSVNEGTFLLYYYTIMEAAVHRLCLNCIFKLSRVTVQLFQLLP
ncbi:hypothetical protein HMPREF1548_06764 [Clostridium sp. KLE 1755]|nr:hypothetical protein HMPREF1548_06764 [Clostridium sp. KLE 1755]